MTENFDQPKPDDLSVATGTVDDIFVLAFEDDKYLDITFAMDNGQRVPFTARASSSIIELLCQRLELNAGSSLDDILGVIGQGQYTLMLRADSNQEYMVVDILGRTT